jgi:signal transduction histidine kinase
VGRSFDLALEQRVALSQPYSGHIPMISGRPRRRPPEGIFASRARVAGIWTAFAGVVVTLVFQIGPGLEFAYRRPALRAGLETTEALVALLVAYLVLGRLGRTRKVDDLVIAVALGVFAGGNLVFGVLPTLLGSGGADPVSGWAGIGIRLVGACLFALAAVAPRRPLWHRLRRAPTVVAVTICVVVLVAVAVAAAALAHDLPQPALPSGQAVAVKHFALFSHGYALVVQIATMVACTVAAVGFARSADRRPDDELLPWLGAAAVFGTYASLNYALSPALVYTDWVYPADVVMLLFYLMLLVGAAREITGYWKGAAQAAALEERRRVARDLHDGLAQELAYISRASKRLRYGDVDGEFAARLESAAERGLRESRLVIAALATPQRPLEAMFERVVHDAAVHHGVEVDLDIGPAGRLDPPRQEALLRIAGEAVANAARHSGAQTIRVVLRWGAGRPRLQVLDRGVGFDVEAARAGGGGFGLTSMRERAAAVGAEFILQSVRGSGTSVEVVF